MLQPDDRPDSDWCAGRGAAVVPAVGGANGEMPVGAAFPAVPAPPARPLCCITGAPVAAVGTAASFGPAAGAVGTAAPGAWAGFGTPASPGSAPVLPGCVVR